MNTCYSGRWQLQVFQCLYICMIWELPGDKVSTGWQRDVCSFGNIIMVDYSITRLIQRRELVISKGEQYKISNKTTTCMCAQTIKQEE